MISHKPWRRIRILYIIDHLIGFAGTEKHLYQLVSFLDKRLFEFDIIALNAMPRMEDNPRLHRNYLLLLDAFREKGVTIRSHPIGTVYEPRTLAHFLRLTVLIRKFKPDIVQTFHFMSDTYGVLASLTAGVKVIVSSRRDMGDYKHRKHIYFNRFFNHFIKRHIAVCDAVAKKMTLSERISKERIEVIYNGINVDEYRKEKSRAYKTREEMGISEKCFVIGIACIFRAEKGLDVFFEAINRVSKRIDDMKVIAVGDGEIRSKLASFCERKHILSDVIFTGYVRDIREYLPLMDIACLTPTKNEGLSNVILEEMAMGLPVVATDVGGNAEQILDGITGRIVPPGNPSLLGDAILELYNNPDLRRSMGQKALSRVRKDFSLQKMIRTTESFYLSLFSPEYS